MEPAAWTTTPFAPLTGLSYQGAATALTGGKVLAIGLDSAAFYDPTTDTWTPTGPLAALDKSQGIVGLLTGEGLAIGGYGIGGRSSSHSCAGPQLGTAR